MSDKVNLVRKKDQNIEIKLSKIIDPNVYKLAKATIKIAREAEQRKTRLQDLDIVQNVKENLIDIAKGMDFDQQNYFIKPESFKAAVSALEIVEIYIKKELQNNKEKKKEEQKGI